MVYLDRGITLSFANLKLTHQGNKLQPKIDPPVTNFR
jgi:hypothetical protein